MQVQKPGLVAARQRLRYPANDLVKARKLTDQQKLSWLRLIRSENVGPRTFHDLLDHFKNVDAAIEALPDLGRRGGRALKLCTIADAQREIESLNRIGARLVALGEPDYPEALAASDAPPPLISVQGNFESVCTRPSVAIVGARNASAAGRSFAARLARDLGEAGFVITSGLARGVDAAAHEASLSSGTIAVLAGGLDRIYPSEHLPLLERLKQNGAAVTEMPLGWEPRARDFPRRNRIIAGLSRSVVVVEAALRSGSLITARLANEMGREVMAAPGSPLDPRCEGSNALLRQGATLITKAEHVIESLQPGFGQSFFDFETNTLREEAPASPTPEPDEAVRSQILELLGPSPAPVDDIVRLSGASARMVQFVLLELELAGRIERHTDGRVSLVK